MTMTYSAVGGKSEEETGNTQTVMHEHRASEIKPNMPYIVFPERSAVTGRGVFGAGEQESARSASECIELTVEDDIS